MKKKYKILYVDDEVSNTKIFKNLFRFDYKVLTANSGAEGMNQLANHPVDLIITDQRMPDMTGIGFLKQVVKKYPEPPRILLTGYSDIEAVKSGINECQIQHYMTKPYDVDDLKRIIDKSLEFYQLRKDKGHLLEQLEEANKGLEVKVQQRTFELEEKNKKLVASETRLAKSNALKDKLFSIISHDFRAPLSSLIGFLNYFESFQEHLSADESQRLVGNIRSHLVSVSELLENLLEWARIQMGHQSMHIQDVLIKSVLDRNYALFHNIAAQKGLFLNITPYTEDIAIRADENMFAFIIRNIINNAIKFTPSSGKITIGVEVADGLAHISIADTGVGMKEEVISKIFDLGENVTTKGTNDERGSGLGLGLCKEYAERQGGTVKVESKFGEGSVFSLSLPLAEKTYTPS